MLGLLQRLPLYAAVAQLVEHLLGKEEVTGSSPVSSYGRARCRFVG